jgi:hypothetical protein
VEDGAEECLEGRPGAPPVGKELGVVRRGGAKYVNDRREGRLSTGTRSRPHGQPDCIDADYRSSWRV